MKRLPLGEGSIQDFGYSIDRVAIMAKLGLLFTGIHRTDADGSSISSPGFKFIPDSPLGRINVTAGHDDLDLLDTAVTDAEKITYEEFKSKYLSFGPYTD